MRTYWIGVLALLALTSLGAPSIGNAGRSAAASPGISAAPARCSKAEATAVVKRLHLGEADFMPNPVWDVICGSFTGPGSQTMVVSLASGGTSVPFEGWAVFRWAGGTWQLVMRPGNGAQVSAAGSDIRETVYVLRPGDQHCCPTGGTRSRIWHWNGTRFTASAWRQSTPATAATEAALVFSPSTAGAACLMTDDGSFRGSWVYCWTGPSESRPTRSVKMGSDGRLNLAATIPEILGKGGPSLPYGGQETVGRFRCLSQRAGMRCTVIRSGKGFLFSSKGAKQVRP